MNIRTYRRPYHRSRRRRRCRTISRVARDTKPALPVEPVAQLPTVDVLVAEVRHRSRPVGQARTTCNGRPGRPRLPATALSAAASGPKPSKKSRSARLRVRPSLRASRSASRSWSRPTAPASWRPSCRPACARSRPKSRRRPAPAASSCRTTAVDVILPKREKNPDGKAVPTSSHSEIILANVRVLGDRSGAEGKDGPEHRGRQAPSRSN